ncbi:MAG: UbiA family prenyltransferase [Pseudomonadota bacterium]
MTDLQQAGRMTPRAFLVLGRVSNLPTVWTNAMAGAALAGAVALNSTDWAVLILSLSLAYVGGMYLNDAFDAEIDAAERSARPIPAGQVAREMVFILGFGMLAAAVLLSFWLGFYAGLAGGALAASVILYDRLHKKTALAPILMGFCRLFTYVLAGLAAGASSALLMIGALGVFAHTIGLTYAAKQEAYDRVDRLWPLAVMAVPIGIGGWMLATSQVPMQIGIACLGLYAAWTIFALYRFVRRAPGDVPKGVVSLIAGIALYDAVMLASVGAPDGAIIAVGLFGLTLLLQRYVPGT